MSSAAVTGEASSASQVMKLSVQGTTCAACAARVEKKLSTVDGVAATVNFATGHAIVTAPAAVSVQQLIDAVAQAGYRAEILVVANSVRLRNLGAPATRGQNWSRPYRARGPSADATHSPAAAGGSHGTGSQELAV